MYATLGFHFHRRFPGHRQRGAVLIVGLILLLVITLVGIGAMQNTTLQEKMAGNLRESNLAFQASEAALRNCENMLDDGIATSDYQLQVAQLDAGFTNAPPAAPPLDRPWCFGEPNLVTANPVTDANCDSGTGAWMWSLDEDQVGALFPGLAANRLDATPGNNRFWWVEGAGVWGVAGNSQALAANTLDGLFAPPSCMLEGYVYAAGDNSRTAEAFRRMRFADGIVIKNELQFRRERNYFRVTSQGLGGNATAVAMLQSGVYQIYFVPNP